MICIYFYVFAAKIGWSLGVLAPQEILTAPLVVKQKETTSRITVHMFSNKLVHVCFYPDPWGEWSNLTKATAMFNCIETNYINVWIHGIPLQHLPFQFRQPVASEHSFKRIYAFSFVTFVDFIWVPLVWLVFADLFAQRACEKTPCLLRLRRDHPRISVAPLWRVAGSSSHDDRHAEHLRYIQLG